MVRTFVTEFKLKKTFLNTTVEKHSDLHEVQNEIMRTVRVLKGFDVLVLCLPVHASSSAGDRLRVGSSLLLCLVK